VLVNFDTADDEETVAAVQLTGQSPELRVKSWQWKRISGNISKGKSKGCFKYVSYLML
jgi:hypothetical protein